MSKIKAERLRNGTMIMLGQILVLWVDSKKKSSNIYEEYLETVVRLHTGESKQSYTHTAPSMDQAIP